MTLADIPAIQQLSREEKLQLVADLWDDIAATPDDGEEEISPEELALLEQRLAEYRTNPEIGLSLEEFKRQLAARI